MSLEINIDPTNQTITLVGRIDSLTSPLFENDIMPLITEKSPNLKLNCEALNYISSTGLRGFIRLEKRTNELNGKITLIGLNSFLKNIFEITGLSPMFTFV
ncbi:MAG: STAS domain-containing protein [Candidatus Margulisiibacteriota bacterium]